MTNTAKCPFCKQIVMLASETDDEDAEERAKELCTCDGAKSYQKRKKRIERACGNIELEFEEHYPETSELLKAAVNFIAYNKIAKITIDTGHGIKGTVGITSKGSIKVTKSISKKVEHDE